MKKIYICLFFLLTFIFNGFAQSVNFGVLTTKSELLYCTQFDYKNMGVFFASNFQKGEGLKISEQVFPEHYTLNIKKNVIITGINYNHPLSKHVYITSGYGAIITQSIYNYSEEYDRNKYVIKTDPVKFYFEIGLHYKINKALQLSILKNNSSGGKILIGIKI